MTPKRDEPCKMPSIHAFSRNFFQQIIQFLGYHLTSLHHCGHLLQLNEPSQQRDIGLQHAGGHGCRTAAKLTPWSHHLRPKAKNERMWKLKMWPYPMHPWKSRQKSGESVQRRNEKKKSSVQPLKKTLAHGIAVPIRDPITIQINGHCISCLEVLTTGL